MTLLSLPFEGFFKVSQKMAWLFFLLSWFSILSVNAQMIGAVTVCTDGSTSQQYITQIDGNCAPDGDTGDFTYAWSVTGGTIVDRGAIYDDNALIVWDPTSSSGTVTASSYDGYGNLCTWNTLTVTISANTTKAGIAFGSREVNPGINSGTIDLVDFAGAIDGWEYSEDGTSWVNLGQAGQEHIFFENLQVTTRFRARMKTCSSGNTNTRSEQCTIKVTPRVVNWTEKKAYSESGMLVAESKNYFDANGNALQAQARNITQNRILVTQPLLDRFDHPVGSTLPAPINRSATSSDAQFGYNPLFATSASNSDKAYGYQEFDTDVTINNPQPTGNAIAGTLGWYYSANNTLEPATPATAYPYSRTETAFDGSTGVIRSTIPGEAFRLGQNHESLSGTFGVVNELNDYLLLRGKYFPNSVAGENPATLAKRAQLTVTLDANRSNKGIAIQDYEGRVVMTAQPGTTTNVTNTVDLTRVDYCEKGMLPANTLQLNVITNSPTDIVTVLDANNVVRYSGVGGAEGNANGLSAALSNTPNWKVVCAVKFSIQYMLDVRYGFQGPITSLEERNPSLVNFALLQASLITVSLNLPSSDYKVVNSVTGADVTSIVKNSATLPEGFYQLTTLYGGVRLTYVNGYKEVSYNFYDQKGQLLGSLSPKGVQQLQSGTSLESGLTAWLPFDQSSGNSVADASGNNNSALLANTTDTNWKTTAGIIGGALELTGSASIQLPLSGNGTAFTFSWWTKPYQRYNYNQLLRVNNGWGDFLFHTDGNGTIYVGTDVGTRIVTATNSLKINEWQQFTFTFVGKVGKLYRNGQLIGSGSGMANPGAWTTVSAGLGLGYEWEGLIDELRVYNRAFTDSEVRELHLTRLPYFTQYEYDTQGHMLAKVEPDAGRTEYLYRMDGKLRFSQNAKQRVLGSYSYIGYDAIGRVFEMGEALGNGTSFGSLRDSHASYLESVGSTDYGGSGLAGYDDLRDIVRTTYDLPNTGHGLGGYQQNFLPGNVSVTAKYSAGSFYSGYTLISRTWYSYDDQGRTQWQIQQTDGQPARTIDYTYDFGGRPLTVCYQKGVPAERFTHYYTYDADKRLSVVETGLDDPSVPALPHAEQARYEYYLHGPLKRVIYGKNLQGVDYAYTAQGWLKSINDGDIARDPGQDGIVNTYLPDLFGSSQHFYPNDYTSRSVGSAAITASNYPARYDGTVQATIWQTPGSPLHMYGYNYDAKGQLVSSTYGRAISSPTRQYSFAPYSGAGGAAFFEGDLSYDLNGNIGHLKRSNETGVSLMNIDYRYLSNTNKLASVNTGAGSSVINYTYDEIGQVTAQEEAAPAKSQYLVYDAGGKVTAIYRDAARTQPVAKYTYDEFGRRLQQRVYPDPVAPTAYTITTFVRDGSGNELASYVFSSTTGVTTLYEQPIYGASRLGIYRRQRDNEPAEQLYELNDQLGNTRVVFRRPKTTKFALSMETARVSQEKQEFPGPDASTYDAVRSSDYFYQYSPYNSSPSPTPFGDETSPVAAHFSVKLLARRGPTKTLAAQRGDKLHITAYALYQSAGGVVYELAPPPAPKTLALGLADVYVNSSRPNYGVTENGKTQPKGWSRALSQFSLGISIPLFSRAKVLAPTFQAATLGADSNGPPPNASLQYVVRKASNNEVVRSGSVPLQQNSVSWQLMSLDVTITETYPVVVEVFAQSNDSYVPAYFDDLTIDYTEGPVVQENHFYAYGQRITGGSTDFMSWERKDWRKYRHGYQGQFATVDEESGYDGFELRKYDSRIGRWTSLDPEREHYSPYVGMGNNPVTGVDPTGGSVLDIIIHGNNGHIIRITDPNCGPDVEYFANLSFEKDMTYTFNDPEKDFADFSNSAQYFLPNSYFKESLFLSVLNVEGGMAYAGVPKSSSYPHYWDALVGGQSGGKLDFSSTYLKKVSEGYPNDIAGDVGNPYFMQGSKIYNYFDAGNFLTGQAFKRIGIPLDHGLKGADFHNRFLSRDWGQKFGTPDSKADQRAISRGWRYK